MQEGLHFSAGEKGLGWQPCAAELMKKVHLQEVHRIRTEAIPMPQIKTEDSWAHPC